VAHQHAPPRPGTPGAGTEAERRRALWWSLGANGGFLVVEVVAGFAFASLALLADAAHMATDASGLAIALAAQTLAARPASARHTYGLARAEVLGALVNGVVLVASAGWIFYEAVQRLGTPEPVDGGGVVVVATLGLGVNVASALALRRVAGRSLNLRGAYLHMALDAAGSVGAIAAGLAVLLAGADWVDPFVSILVGLLVLWSTWSLLRDTVQVLLEGTPRGISVATVQEAITAQAGVREVHHVHVWDLASETPALSAHVVLDGEPSLHDAQLRGDGLKAMLARRFGIAHATLELECHDCEAPDRS
jgi:cobalt-zinc-cadmium efflux system protein